MAWSRTRVAVVFLALSISSAPSVSPANGAQGELRGSRRLQAVAENLLQVSNDFLSLAEARIEHAAEYQIASDLSGVASTCAEYLGAAADFLLLHEALSSPSDRIRVRNTINGRLTYYAKLIDNSIKLIDNRIKLANLRLARTESAALVGKATRLRDILRESAALLRSLEIP